MALLVASPVAPARVPEVFILSSLERVLPRGTPRGEAVARLEAARGEWESFQVVVRAGAAAVEMTVEASALEGPHGAKLPPPQVARVALLQLRTPSSDEGGAGAWPDPLVPSVDAFDHQRRRAFPWRVEAGSDGAAWIDLFVPRDAAPGRYRGRVLIRDRGALLAELPVELFVHRFALPATSSLPAAFGFAARTAARSHLGRTPTDEEALAIGRRYALAALRDRVSLMGGLMDPAPHRIVDGAVRVDFAPYDAEVAPFLDGKADPGGPAEGARWSAFDLRSPARLEAPAEEQYLRATAEHLRARGWWSRAFVYLYDEPSDAQLPEVRARALPFQRAIPDAPRLVTHALDPRLDGAASLWCPVVNQLDDRPGQPGRPPRDAYPERLWWYQSCLSHGCDIVGGGYFSGWPSYAIDAPATAHRAMEWLSFRYRVGGELYYNTVEAYEDGDPWRDPRRHGGNGDGTLFYPGRPSEIGGTTHIPIESIRLKRIRDGLEDYEYLALYARAAGRAAADRIAARVASSTHEVARDPKRMLAARAELARLLDALPVAER